MIPGEELTGSGYPENEPGSKQVPPCPGVSSDPLICILYVDDDPDMALFFTTYIRKIGNFQVFHSKNGRDALSFLSKENTCDIVISDYYMPGMDGIELLKQIHTLPSSPPFILFTGKGREEVVMEAINNGAAFYLQKGGDTHTLYAELVHKIRQAVGKQHAEEALRESEKKFRLLFESARDAILIIKNGIVVDCNMQASGFFRVDHGKLIGMSIGDLSPGVQPDGSDSREKFEVTTASVITGEHSFLVWRHRRLDGTTFDAEASLNRIDLNREICIQVAIRDITDRLTAEHQLNERTIELSAAYEELLAAEEEQRAHLDEIVANQAQLAESEQKYRELADLLPLIVFECDQQGLITYANHQAYVTFGYTPDTTPADLRVIDLIIPEEQAAAIKSMSEISQNGRTQPREYHALRRDGSIFPVLIHAAPIVKGGNFIGFRGIVIDITDQKKSEEAIIRSEEKYRTLIEHIQDGVFIIQEGILQFVNPAFAAIIGTTIENITGKKIKGFIAPEEWELVVDRYHRRLAGESVPGRYEFMMLHADGQTRILVSMDIGMIMFQGQKAIIGTIRDITKQKQAEEAVRESKRRLADVIDFLPDATFVIDREGRVITWNRAMEQLTGVTAADILGKGDYEYAIPFYGVKRPILIDLALKADDQIEQQYLSMDRIGDMIIGEAYMPKMREGTAYLWGVSTPLRDSIGNIVGAIESIRDITDRKRVADELEQAKKDLEKRVADRTAELTKVNKTLINEVEERRLVESALRESEERYRRVVELSPDAIFVHDGTRILFINQAGVRLLGASAPRDIIGLGFQKFIHSDFSEKSRTHIDLSEDKTKAGLTSEEKFIRIDGSDVDVEVSSASIIYQGSPALLVEVRDITGRKRVAEQLRRYAEEMSQKNKELDFLANQLLDVNQDLDRRVRERTEQVIALLKQKDDFITQLGHDLKTPLTPLRALLPSLIEAEQNPEIRDSLTVLLRSTHAIQDQTEKILAIARLNRDNVVIHPEPVLIRPCISDSIQKNQHFIERKNLNIIIDIPDEQTFLFSYSDACTVFDNLINNAVKYSSDGNNITIRSSLEKDNVCVKVVDEGIGLSPEEAAHVFDEFYMADSSRHDRSSSGLGLAIVRRLVSLYGGSVHVESKGKGMGATFSVCVPHSDN